jgi:hypothetical protein
MLRNGADDGTLGEYTTSGKTVNPALLSGLGNPFAGFGPVGVATGAPVNRAPISGLFAAGEIAVISAPVPEAITTWLLLMALAAAVLSLRRRVAKEEKT